MQMGGRSSSRYASDRSKRCEGHLALDLAWVRRNSLLRSGQPVPITLSRGGKHRGNNLNALALPDGVRLMYRTRRDNDGAWEDVSETMPYVWTRTRFGGRRAWFKCLGCGRGCRVLYGGSRFRCRRCHGLTYRSQYEPAYERANEQANKLRKRVGGKGNAFTIGNTIGIEEFPPKPRGMHWATYWRLKERYDELLNTWIEGLIRKIGLSS
jgi:hypothetical protein